MGRRTAAWVVPETRWNPWEPTGRAGRVTPMPRARSSVTSPKSPGPARWSPTPDNQQSTRSAAETATRLPVCPCCVTLERVVSTQ